VRSYGLGDRGLAYGTAGDAGDPVVLVHGGWDDHHLWDRIVPGLSGSLQVLVYDRSGHGESPARTTGSPVVGDAEDLARLLEGTDHYPAHVVAHAYGAAVGFRLAVDRPELVRSLAFHEAPFFALLDDDRASHDEGGRLRAELERIRGLALSGAAAEAADAYLDRFGSAEEDVQALRVGPSPRTTLNATAWAREMGDTASVRPPLEELAVLSLPVLATSGGRSPAFAARINDRLVARLPNAQALRLPDGGHRVPETEPDLYVGILGTFLLERNVPST
jgi:pimeloyl-ACP methyl ester carboxylesterase